MFIFRKDKALSDSICNSFIQTFETCPDHYKHRGVVSSDSKGIHNDDKVKTNVVENAGTIDYDTGEVVVNNFAPTAYEGIEIKVTATPENLDIVPTQETIIVLDPEAATITATAES